MKKEILFEIPALYRDDFRITGYRFGHGKHAIAIVGTMRGNEYQQLYICQSLIRRLNELEEQGRIAEGMEILVIPCVNPYSINVKKRFWPLDNTDVNRMFPGYDEGETTQRIADAVFKQISDYTYGIQLASFYMPGTFLPHVRMMTTGYEDVELGKEFGMPYVVLHQTRPFDTATLNYNWQIWGAKAFSVYTTNTDRLDRPGAQQGVEAILQFMSRRGVIRYNGYSGYISKVIRSNEMITVRSHAAGFFDAFVRAGERVHSGELMAEIIHPYEGTVLDKIISPVDGTVWLEHGEPMVYEATCVFKLIPNEP